MEKSIWSRDVLLPEYPELRGDIKTDVLIIGGGICGILCAYFLKKSGVDCVIAEATKIAQGVTCNTTAKITSLHGLLYDDMICKFGKEKAQKYFDINEKAVKKYEELCKHIDCDFEIKPAYTFSKYNAEKIEKEAKALECLGAKTEFLKDSPLPFYISAMVGIKDQAQFNPLKFIKEILKDLNIYENTPVRKVCGNIAICDHAKISAEKIIVATHFPFINKHGNFFLKLYQHRSYVLALEGAQNLSGMYVEDTEGGLSFRNSGDLLLLGGGGARTGKKCGNWKELENFRMRNYPKSKVITKWATQDCMSLDKIPYVGQYSKTTPNLYVATGFNKWGMTSAMVSAMILSDLVQGIKNDYSDVFSPSRNILTPQLFVNGFETFSNLLLPTTKRCPHLGCALKWNKHEHTWDCPCHGSRFEKNGKLINNPATKNADNV